MRRKISILGLVVMIGGGAPYLKKFALGALILKERFQSCPTILARSIKALPALASSCSTATAASPPSRRKNTSRFFRSPGGLSMILTKSGGEQRKSLKKPCSKKVCNPKILLRSASPI